MTRLDPELEAAAMIAAAGIDPTRYMTAADELEQAMIVAVAARATELRVERDEQLARMIRNEVVEGFGG